MPSLDLQNLILFYINKVKPTGTNVLLLAGGSIDTVFVGSHQRNAEVFSNW